MLASALRLPARCPPRWSAPACPALGACHRHSAQAPSLGAPRGLDAVADLARQMQDDSSALRGADARSALLADDRHHQTHEYKVRTHAATYSTVLATCCSTRLAHHPCVQRSLVSLPPPLAVMHPSTQDGARPSQTARRAGGHL